MAFPDPLVLVDNTPANQNFTRAQTPSGTVGSKYVEDDAVPTNERTFSIRHQNAGTSAVKGAPPKQQHTITLELRKFNAVIGATEIFKINLSCIDDPTSSITAAEKKHVAAMVGAFISDDTNLEKLLRGEI